MFAVAAGILLATVVVLLLFPLWLKSSTDIPMGPEAAKEQERIDLEIEKQTLLNSLAELEFDFAQGRLTPPDYQRLKAVDEYRIGRVLEKLDLQQKQVPAAPPQKTKQNVHSSRPMQWTASIAMALLVLGSAAGIYRYIHGRIGIEAQQYVTDQPDASSGQGMPNPIEMVARLEKRLKENPDDLQGQIMAGRSYMTLQRMEDARNAWAKVIEMDFGNHEAHYFLGLILLQTNRLDDQKSTEEALNHFETALVKVPREPALLWYKGVALLRLKQYGLADKSWTEAFQNLDPSSEDAKFVKESLQSLRAGNPPVL